MIMKKPIVGNKYMKYVYINNNICIDGCIEVEIVGYNCFGTILFFKYGDGSIGSSTNFSDFIEKKQELQIGQEVWVKTNVYSIEKEKIIITTDSSTDSSDVYCHLDFVYIKNPEGQIVPFTKNPA